MNIGHAQPFARCLAWQEIMLPLMQMPPLAVMLAMGVGQKTRSQEHRMLAIFLAQHIDALVEVG